MIWKGQEICVLQKPADWICSASDVDKKKGRKLDPNEDLRNKGFKIMKDLMDYKFAEREKKYIHWWIQLTHDTNREEYPNLFDVDQNYGLCHRLDRETSGTVLVGITKKSRTQMRECFHRHYVRKLYVCLVHGFIDKAEQTVDRNLEAMGQKAKLDRRGKRARTHVKVLGYFTRTHKSGRVDEFTLCTCEIAEGRMHQIRLHMAAALGSPIVSEFYYQKAKQMIEDRRWCQRVFLHAYAVGFPDMGAVNDDDKDEEGDCEEDDEEKLRVEDTEQEWHCCICPLTNELRKVMKDLKPRKEQLKGVQAETMLQSCLDSGLISPSHKEVHCKGTQQRGQLIDDVFFPWSSKVNPIQVGDLAKVRADASQRQKQQALIQQQHEERLEKQKSRRSFSRDAPREGREGQGTVALRPKAKARGRDSISPRRKRGVSMGSKRPRVGRGRLRSPGPPPPPAKDRSAEPSLSPSDDVKNPPVNRQVTRGRVRSRSGRVIRRRLPGPPAPPSPPCRRSSSVIQRRGKRRKRDAPMPQPQNMTQENRDQLLDELRSPDRPEPDKRGVRSQLGGRRRGGALSQVERCEMEDPQHFHYEIRIVLAPSSPAQEALDALRDAGHEQLPRGPAHVTLGEFTCASTEENQRLTLLADLCGRLHPAAFHVEGRARCRRGRKPAYFLPVELSAAAESIVEELQQLKLLDRAKVNFHVSVGREGPIPEIQPWDGWMERVTILKLVACPWHLSGNVNRLAMGSPLIEGQLE
eukprot:symbB.v1.2.021108.t1/scaffold1717.1/size104954/11